MRQKDNSKILITGCAGFIGYHLAKRLLEEGHSVVGLDSLSNYYDINLKISRLNLLKKFSNFVFINSFLENVTELNTAFDKYCFDIVINLAAQAGVRYSLENPRPYIDSNIIGFLNLLEASRFHKIEHLIYASSSSVYGLNKHVPFSTEDNVDHPVSLYAATKKSNELMAHSYSHLYGIPVTGLRFFTVYGPWGRPDMALFTFIKSILEEEPIKIYNNGNMKRDFTYIDDIVEAIIRLIPKKPLPNGLWEKDKNISSSSAPYKIYNIGNNSPVLLMDFISIIEECLGKKAIREYLPMQPGDVISTYADVEDLYEEIDFKPSTPIKEGVMNFINWYKHYYNIK